MYWIYILQCEDNYYYVGETSRLFRRFWEHFKGEGGVNTFIHKPINIVAIYKVNTIGKFIEYNNYVSDINNEILKNYYNFDEEYDYDNKEIENYITECFMMHYQDNWNKIRGGKYIRFDITYKCPNNNYVKEIPLCYCGLPCDVQKKNDYFYFRCAKKNMWENFREIFDIEQNPCNYFEKYLKDSNLEEKRKNLLNKLLQKSSWLKNVEICDEIDNININTCIGNCNNIDITKFIIYPYSCKIRRRLCFNCFIDKHQELSQKYNVKGKCLIKIKE